MFPGCSGRAGLGCHTPSQAAAGRLHLPWAGLPFISALAHPVLASRHCISLLFTRNLLRPVSVAIAGALVSPLSEESHNRGVHSDCPVTHLPSSSESVHPHCQMQEAPVALWPPLLILALRTCLSLNFRCHHITLNQITPRVKL